MAATFCAASEEVAAQLARREHVNSEQLVRIGNALRSTLKLLGITGKPESGPVLGYRQIVELNASRRSAMWILQQHRREDPDPEPAVRPVSLDMHKK